MKGDQPPQPPRVTLTSFLAKKALPSLVMATAYTSDDWPILERVAKLASTSGETFNIAISALGFFSTNNSKRLVLAKVVP